MDAEKLRKRIRARLAEIGETPISAARKAGLERSYIRDFLDGTKQSISAKHFGKVASALHWTAQDLLGFQKPSTRSNASNEPILDVQLVPEINLRMGASRGGGLPERGVILARDGRPDPDAIRAEWGIPVPFLRDELGVKPSRVHILPIRGDSMADALQDGDRAIIDLDDIDVAQGGIFAVQDDTGAVIVKQIEIVRGTERPTIRCKSRNPNYEPFDLSLGEPVRIIGRVACRITRL